MTFDELRELKRANINALRIPVGYWIVRPRAGEPFVDGGLRFLLRLLNWASQVRARRGARACTRRHAEGAGLLVVGGPT
ncbi:hypothetical protein OAO87_03045 [bacterium]|nr:hypothetical protein [bacterium]